MANIFKICFPKRFEKYKIFVGKLKTQREERKKQEELERQEQARYKTAWNEITNSDEHKELDKAMQVAGEKLYRADNTGCRGKGERTFFNYDSGCENSEMFGYSCIHLSDCQNTECDNYGDYIEYRKTQDAMRAFLLAETKKRNIEIG